MGDQPRAGLKGAIPPGRYTVELTPGFEPGQWYRCSSVLCGPTYTENSVGEGLVVGAGYSQVMEILLTDVAVYLFGVTLTPVQ